jgi:hypothetical protein
MGLSLLRWLFGVYDLWLQFCNYVRIYEMKILDISRECLLGCKLFPDHGEQTASAHRLNEETGWSDEQAGQTNTLVEQTV